MLGTNLALTYKLHDETHFCYSACVLWRNVDYPVAETYETRNAAQGPHKGSKLVSAETGAPGIGRLRPRHRAHTLADAFRLLGFSSKDLQKPLEGMW